MVAVQTFGELVRSRRRSLGWTQDELAARAGVSDRTVREIERNRRTSHRRNVKALVAALSLSEQEMGLFEGTARQGSEAISLRTEPTTSSSGLSTLLTPLVNRERETEIITTMFQRPSTRWLK
jgi:transcriptional regulator with XRE-family HTH domain